MVCTRDSVTNLKSETVSSLPGRIFFQVQGISNTVRKEAKQRSKVGIAVELEDLEEWKVKHDKRIEYADGECAFFSLSCDWVCALPVCVLVRACACVVGSACANMSVSTCANKYVPVYI